MTLTDKVIFIFYEMKKLQFGEVIDTENRTAASACINQHIRQLGRN